MIRLKSEIWLKVDKDLDRFFLFCTQTGRHFVLNEVSHRMVELIKENKEKAEIIEELVRDYEVSPAECKKDLEDLIQSLERANLVEPTKGERDDDPR